MTETTTPSTATPSDIKTSDELPDVLARICARTRLEVEHRSTLVSLKEITARAQDVKEAPRGFCRALKEKSADRSVGLIAELKKASPSAGILQENYNPAAIAQAYEQAGAACLSVLTESSCFHGSNEDLQAARAATSLPVLRKDFIIDPWQVYESRTIGADCILLIVGILSDEELQELVDHAKGLEMDVLLEVHDEEELNRALAIDAFLIGINNRNLRTLITDIETTVVLTPLVPPDRIIVSESGIKTHAEVTRLTDIGVTGFLVGESLLRQPDPGQAARVLLGRA
ncbi:indole-3-glycerol phosphate synthase TrpC [Acetobacter thailandicus]|uniref:Indole-3-glycerol phosphate synthase n=1 Tax=Acetobacter thailandicus TaxID=1502842 RepID=A0ABT3QG36_9PROT|nr:indole-3-glycerol phosphate synthase TrpC [Acetobacter thailandicus]MCX2564215.1 indole-3-glycerol phosphate synthase TrpC [Acetobacter thailandicus]NHN95559.1 indole-3-glycerol phosphate synthase TrpC [Acetobacter thailandicus]